MTYTFSPGPLFQSYATKDRRLAETLQRGLADHLKAAGAPHEIWQDNQRILVGERWHETILQTMDTCRAGLLLLSPAFLASDYIRRHEVPRFLRGDKPIIPVLLKPLGTHADLQGIQHHQIFALESPRSGRKAFSQCDTTRRETFILQLADQILDRLAAAPAPNPT